MIGAEELLVAAGEQAEPESAEVEDGDPWTSAVIMYSTAVDALNAGEEKEDEAELLLTCCIETIHELAANGRDLTHKTEGRQDRKHTRIKRMRTEKNAEPSKQLLLRQLSPEAKNLMAESLVLIGRIVEWSDPNRALVSYQDALESAPQNAEAHLQLGRLEWKSVRSQKDLDVVESRLRTAIELTAEDEESDTCAEAMHLLIRLLCQNEGRQEEAHELLADMGYQYVLSRALTSTVFESHGSASSSAAGGAKSSESKLAAIREAPSAVNVIDNSLTPELLELMQEALAPSASFWQENSYDSPRTGFFSFQHSLPPFSQVVDKEAGGAGDNQDLNLDSVLQHVWRVAAEAVPDVKKARFVEWWAHSRPHSNGTIWISVCPSPNFPTNFPPNFCLFSSASYFPPFVVLA
jgi:hypothetical protein